MGGDLVLGRPLIVVDDAEASYVTHAARDLQLYLAELNERDVPLRSPGGIGDLTPYDAVIAVGSLAIASLAARNLDLRHLVPELKGSEAWAVAGGRVELAGRRMSGVAVAGSDAQGLKLALIQLTRRLGRAQGLAALRAPLRWQGQPRLRKRAMYAHLHWQFNYPYACRRWQLEDWKKYVDLLAYFGVNQLQIWPMIGLIPDPLSDEDAAYLTMYRDLVDYAHEARGMQVWLGETVNNVAGCTGGVPIGNREYFHTEVLKNPAVAEDMAAIVRSRRNLYSIVNNADGYWVIDSDPGGWPGSPVSDFVDVCLANRRLIDECHTRGSDVPLIYWMHWGWGTKSQPENWRDALLQLQERLPEPWLILANNSHLDLVQELGLAEKTLFFPYGAVEAEPSAPQTMLFYDNLVRLSEVALQRGLLGQMAQAQTPLVQLPNVFLATSAMGDAGVAEAGRRGALEDLAALFYPDLVAPLAVGWELLADDAAASGQAALSIAAELAGRLDEGRLGRPGPLARFLLPDFSQVVADLVHLLRIRGYALQLKEGVARKEGPARLRDTFYHYLRAGLTWQMRHGYQPMGGCKYLYGPYVSPVKAAIKEYGPHWAAFHFIWPAKSRLYLEREFHFGAVDGIVTEVTQV